MECSSMYCNNDTANGRRCESLFTADFGFYCDKTSDCKYYRCDFNKKQCTPWCRIGGCFCQLDDDCDSGFCYNWYCRSVGYSAAWVLCVVCFIVIVCLTLWFIWKCKHVPHYTLATKV